VQIDRDAIMQAKEKLGDDNARIIIEELGIVDYDERDMKCCCPFHQEHHASFITKKHSILDALGRVPVVMTFLMC